MDLVCDHESDKLSSDECRELLLTATSGRLAITRHGSPTLVPVGISIDEPDLVLEPLVGLEPIRDADGTFAVLSLEDPENATCSIGIAGLVRAGAGGADLPDGGEEPSHYRMVIESIFGWRHP